MFALNSVELKTIDVPLTEEEIEARRIENSVICETEDYIKAELEKKKAELEHETEWQEKKSRQKLIRAQLRTKSKSVTLRTVETPNPETRTVEVIAAESREGYEEGEKIMDRPMTRQELFQFNLLPGRQFQSANPY